MTATSKAVHALLDTFKGLEAKLAGLPADDEQSVLEGYKWMFSILEVALDAYVWADSDNPRFVEIVGPYKKWGGDNADAFYQYAPVDPNRTYRIRGKKGDAVYFSLTVYGGPSDGRYSERIVGSVNDRDVRPDPDGIFDVILSSDRPADDETTAWVKLEPDAVCAVTRDYLLDPIGGRRMSWHIESLDPPQSYRERDADLARRFQAAATWLVEQAKIVPIPLGEPNRVDEPYPVPKVTYGWAAGDAAYAMGSYQLAEDEALVIDGRSPECAFWNMCLWNPFLHTYNYDYERVTINGGQVVYDPDGSWRIVVAHRDPGHANWVSTAGHLRGRIWFRWFLPADTPSRPEARVVPLADVNALPKAT
ncbi:MAG TPA: DUF1214 domain-containing protein [Acidimicrobiales bacterium]|nr:DUF1214 domain-containing protein [Acidimicrobiales bacterium]